MKNNSKKKEEEEGEEEGILKKKYNFFKIKVLFTPLCFVPVRIISLIKKVGTH